MTLYRKRERFSSLSVSIGRFFSKAGLSPNQWTLLTLLPALLAFCSLWIKDFRLAAAFVMLAAFLDLVDGSVARVMGRTSRKGAFYDTVMDRYVEFLIILGLATAGLPDMFMPAYFWLLLYLFGAMMTTYVKAAAKEKSLVDKELKGGVLERAERMILLFIGLVAGIYSRTLLVYLIMLMAVLSNVTVIQRAWKAVRD